MRISDWSSDVCSSDLTAEELERSNRRLSGEESYTVAPSRYLGHYVAGQLAARLGVTVRLQDNPAGGLIATIVVPPTLLEVPADEASPTPTNQRPPAAPDPHPPTPAETPVDDTDLPASPVVGRQSGGEKEVKI